MRLQRLVLLGLALVVLAIGCSPARSTAAFCQALRTETAALKERYGPQLDQAQASDDLSTVLGGLVTGMQAIGEFNRMLPKLAKHAPDEIRADMEELARLSAQQSDLGSGDLLGNLAAGLIGGLMAGGAAQRVDAFAERECGQALVRQPPGQRVLVFETA